MLKIRSNYDVIVIGSGPAAIASALKCSDHGMKVLCTDNLPPSDTTKFLPGTFTSAPVTEITTLLESAKLFCELNYNRTSHGIIADNISLNLPQLLKSKNKILNQINKSNSKKFAYSGIDFINAISRLLTSNSVEIKYSTREPSKIVYANNIILATDSKPIAIQCAQTDDQYIYDSSNAFNFTEIPNRIAILGAGVIGLEIANIWNRLGSEIILLDAQETFLNLVDNQISRKAYKVFIEQGLELRLGTRVVSTKILNSKVTVEYQDAEGNHAIRVDKLIVASGRKPCSEQLATSEANLLIDQNNYVYVNENCRSNLPNVYAIGDLTMLGPMLPQKGIAEGIFVADQIAGINSSPISYETIPNVIYTAPEIAWVGQTEQALKSKGENIETVVVDLNYHTSSKSPNYTQGVVKVIACPNSDRIKGIHIMANNASELIAEATLAMEFASTTEDLARTSHSHPSFSEAIKEACQLVKNKIL